MKKGHARMKTMIATLGLLAALTMATGAMAAKVAPASPVNINTAGVEQLMEIPGIGASKAEAIVAHRSNTKFASVDELTSVKGIGEKLLAKISPFVTVAGGAQAKTGTAGKSAR